MVHWFPLEPAYSVEVLARLSVLDAPSQREPEIQTPRLRLLMFRMFLQPFLVATLLPFVGVGTDLCGWFG